LIQKQSKRGTSYYLRALFLGGDIIRDENSGGLLDRLLNQLHNLLNQRLDLLLNLLLLSLGQPNLSLAYGYRIGTSDSLPGSSGTGSATLGSALAADGYTFFSTDASTFA